MTAFDSLMAFQHETEALAQVAGRLGWDQETVMPRGAGSQLPCQREGLHRKGS